jgi:hypothetical protein
MTSVDINIPFDGAFHAVALTGTTMIVFNKAGSNLLFRYGAGSTSSGLVLEANQIVTVSETIYVKISNDYKGNASSLPIVVTQ